MLYLETRDLKIAQITKILLRYDVEASISNNAIKLKGEVSDELVSELLDSITILSISNFEENAESNDNISEHPVEYHEILRRNDCKLLSITDDYELRYPNPKAGEVYMCDFGIPYGHELGGIRPALVVSIQNLGTVVCVVPFKSKINNVPIKYQIAQNDGTFEEIMHSEYSRKDGGLDFANERSIDKKRLRDYFGKLKPEIFHNCQKILLSIFKTRESNNFEIINQILSKVDIDELNQILIKPIPKIDKIKAIFTFLDFELEDIKTKYLIKAILFSFRYWKFDMKYLVHNLFQSDRDSKTERYTEQQIYYFIDSVVKEKFSNYGCTTLDFISVIKDIIKTGDTNEKSNI